MWVVVPIMLHFLIWLAGSKGYTTPGLGREGGEGYLVAFVWGPFWLLTFLLAVLAWNRGGFAWIPLDSGWRLLAVLTTIGIGIVAFGLYAQAGFPEMRNLYFGSIVPLLLTVTIAMAFLPKSEDPAALWLARGFALCAIVLPLLVAIAPAAAAIPGEIRRAEAEARKEAAAADQVTAGMMAELMALPLDCPMEQMWEYASGSKPAVVNEAAFLRMAQRPTIEADLSKMLRAGHSSAPFFIAYHLPKPTAGLAPALNDYLKIKQQALRQSAADGEGLFARDMPGYESTIMAIRAVQKAGGNVDEGLDAWQQTLEALVKSAPRNSLLREVQSLRKRQ